MIPNIRFNFSKQEGIKYPDIAENGNFNLYAPDDIALYPNTLPKVINTGILIKGILGLKIQVHSSEKLASLLVSIPGGSIFVPFNKNIKISLMNYGNNLIKIKKNDIIAEFSLVPKIDVNFQLI